MDPDPIAGRPRCNQSLNKSLRPEDFAQDDGTRRYDSNLAPREK